MKEYKMPIKDVWNMTFREFSLINNSGDKKPFRLEYSREQQKSIINGFELRELYDGKVY